MIASVGVGEAPEREPYLLVGRSVLSTVEKALRLLVAPSGGGGEVGYSESFN